MPELPDVEILREFVQENTLNKKIRDIRIIDPRIIQDTDIQNLKNVVIGKSFSSVVRHGKHLFLDLNGAKWLTMHFGMTGNLLLVKEELELIRFERLSILFNHNQRLAFVDQRILGRVGLVSSPLEYIRSHSLGPDALQISLDEFLYAMHKTKSPVKTALMDQSKIAGIGNVYADEILFQSKTSPFAMTSELSSESNRTIYKNIDYVLNSAIKLRADRANLPDSFITKFRKKAAKCPSCNQSIESVKINGRTTLYCPRCQIRK